MCSLDKAVLISKSKVADRHSFGSLPALMLQVAWLFVNFASYKVFSNHCKIHSFFLTLVRDKKQDVSSKNRFKIKLFWISPEQVVMFNTLNY